MKGHEEHEVLFAVRQRNIGTLDDELARRSSPGSPLYQQWLSFEQIGEIIDTDQSFEAIRAYVERHPGAQIVHVSRRKEYVKVKAPVALLNEMFCTQFHKFVDRSEKNNRAGGRRVTEEGRTFIRAYDYTIPAELVEHLHTVFHTVQVPPVIVQHATVLPPDGSPLQRKSVYAPSLRRRLSSQSISATGYVDPIFLQYNYNIPTANGSSLINQSVFETDSQYFSPDDLLQFQKIFGLPQQAAIAPEGFTTNDCSLTDTPNCNEGNLDIQYIMALAQNTVTLYSYIGTTSDAFVDYLSDIADDPYPSLANSISWGSTEQSENNSTMFNFNLEAKKLGLMGVTVTVSSGDDGAANHGATTCVSSKDATRNNCACSADSSSSIAPNWQGPAWTGSGYFPSFPSTSPYVTSVGATMGPQIAAEEVACQSNTGGVITSGGGFSTGYSRPGWQDAAVTGYFSGLSSAPSAGYNPNGRGYPDLAMIGVYYEAIIGGSTQNLFGTSASAPVVAAMVSLLNSYRLRSNQSSVGFLNPTMYANSGLFNDITSGSNNCASSTVPSAATCCSSGFSCSKGWDPVTGLGSVQFNMLAKMFNVTYDDPGYFVTAASSGDDDSLLWGFTRLQLVYIFLSAFLAVGCLGCCLQVYQGEKERRASELVRQQAGVQVAASPLHLPPYVPPHVPPRATPRQPQGYIYESSQHTITL